MGHEFTSLVLALLQVGGHPPKIAHEVAEAVRALEGDYHFETYFSLSCQICPDVVQALNAMSVLNRSLTLGRSESCVVGVPDRCWDAWSASGSCLGWVVLSNGGWCEQSLQGLGFLSVSGFVFGLDDGSPLGILWCVAVFSVRRRARCPRLRRPMTTPAAR